VYGFLQEPALENWICFFGRGEELFERCGLVVENSALGPWDLSKESKSKGDLGSTPNPACYMRAACRPFWTGKGAMFRSWGAMKRLGP